MKEAQDYIVILYIAIIACPILLLILLIIVSNVSSNINNANNITKQYLHHLVELAGINYKCVFCGFESVNKSDFCPVCNKGMTGKTLEELKNLLSEKPFAKIKTCPQCNKENIFENSFCMHCGQKI